MEPVLISVDLVKRKVIVDWDEDFKQVIFNWSLVKSYISNFIYYNSMKDLIRLVS